MGMKEQKYREERPAEAFAHFHERTRSKPTNPFAYAVLRATAGPMLYGAMRLRVVGQENVPASGGGLLAPNHFSHWDHFATGLLLKRKLHPMGKSQLFHNPALGKLLNTWGAFPLRRGAGDTEAMETARVILERGDLVLMYPEGGRSRVEGTLSGRAKYGIGMLALKTGVPVVPVAIHGSDALRHWRRDMPRLKFPRITIWYGNPVPVERAAEPTRDQAQAVADEVFTRVRAMYGWLDRQLQRSGQDETLRLMRADPPDIKQLVASA
jgi:1-acyl-sn-glycerol-3-phosphate acyltransferase